MENIIEVNQSNIETEHICCAIGNDPVNRRRADDKKAWMDQRRGDGHRFIKADLRGKVFAEFEPAENAWAPIRADGYQFIQCLWASGRYQGKGYGRELIDRVKTEVLAADPHCRGLVIISSNKKRPFMVAPGFLHAMGFSPVDHGEPWFDLYALKFDVDAPDPRFEDRARQAEIIGENGERPKGFDFFYSRGCPFNADFSRLMADMAMDAGFEVRLNEIHSREEALALPVAWGLFSVFYQGQFVNNAIYPGKSWEKYLAGLD